MSSTNWKRMQQPRKSLTALKSNEWIRCKAHFGNRCAYCGRVENSRYKLTKDHVWPRHHWGPDVSFNIVPACQRCNSSKGKKNIHTWYPQQPFYSPARLAYIAAYMASNIMMSRKLF